MSTDRATCSVDAELPGCETSPAGRLAFVVREARLAWRARQARRHDAGVRSDNLTDSPGGTR